MIDEELELPLPDGEDEEKPAVPEDEATTPTLEGGEGDLDDAEQGGSLAEIQAELDVGEDQKWLEGSEDADDSVAHDDASLHETGGSLLGDEDSLGVEGEDFGLVEESATTLDQGEEGFEGEDVQETGELPNLDADEEGEIEDDLGFEPASETLPPWDDRGWEKMSGPHAIGAVSRLWLEAGAIVALLENGVAIVDPSGAIVRHGPRPESVPEIVKKRVPAIEGATAEVSYASGAVAAIHSEAQERTWLVRTGQGGPRIVADVTDDAGDVDAAPVMALVVEPTRGWVWVGGKFGLLAYRPPKKRD